MSIKVAKRTGSVYSVVLTILALMIVVPGSTQAAELNDPILARVADVLAGYSVAKPPPQLRGAESLYRSQVRAVPVIISDGSLGSGIVLKNSPQVIIITNEHVVRAALSIDGKPTVLTIFYDDGLNDERFEPVRFMNCVKKPDTTRWCAALHRQLRYATVVATDADRDLALLQVDGAPPNLPEAMPANESEALDPGKPVAVIGHPKGFLWTYTTGIVSNAERHRPDSSATFIQTQAPINPGNSGGPMFGLDGKLDGKLVGIIQSKYASSEGLNFAISVKDVMTFARPQLKAP